MNAPAPLTMGEWTFWRVPVDVGRSRRSRENTRRRRDIGRVLGRMVATGPIQFVGQIIPGVIETAHAPIRYDAPTGFIYTPEQT